AGLVHRVLRAVTNGADEAVLIARGQLRADGEKRREARRLHEIPPVVVNSVFEARIARGIGAALALQHDRPAVRQDEAIPNQQDPALAEGDAGVVFTDEAASLRDE